MGAFALSTSTVTDRELAAQGVSSAPTVATQLLRALRQCGIDTYFGVPGGAIEPLFDALGREQGQGRVRLLSMRSEAGCAFAADGYFRATRRPAVCMSTTGPGASNLVTGVMNAHADRIPMLVLTPQTPLCNQGRGALQDSSAEGHDITRIFETCTKYSTTITHPDQLGPKLMKALVRMQSGPKGPVHLSIPSDILKATSDLELSIDWSALRPAEAFDAAGVARLGEALEASRHPVFCVGDDAGPQVDAVLTLAEHLGARVVSSPAGKGWLGHLHPAYDGVIGFAGHHRAQATVDQSDLVVTLGTTFDELSTNQWKVFGDAPIIAVDLHSEHTHRVGRASHVLGDSARVVQTLLRRFDGAPRVSPQPSQPKSGARAAVGRIPQPNDATPDAVHPAALMKWLGDNLPDDVVVHVDTGNSFCWSTHHLKRAEPDTYRVSMGLSSMCWAISAAIGSALGVRRRTLCICGDGSMLMSGLELTTAVQQQLPVTYIVLNDSCLGMVRHGQRLSGAEAIGFEIPEVRFDAIALACGARGVRVSHVGQLAALPQECLSDDDSGPWLVDVRIDREAVPPILARVQGLGMQSTR